MTQPAPHASPEAIAQFPEGFVQPFLFEELDIRGRLVCLTGAWRRMLEGRSYPPSVIDLLGSTTALAVLLGDGQKQAGRRVTLQVRGDGQVPLLVSDCTAELRIRGMAQHALDAKGNVRELLGNGRLALMLEDPQSSQVYQSFVPIEGETMRDVFQHYLTQSEQLPTFLGLGADEHALFALLLEKLPGADARDADGWDRACHLAATLTLDETRAARPYDLLTRLFPEELLRVYKLAGVEYHCPRDADKVKEMLRSLGRVELESILRDEGEIVIRNEMCNHEYRFGWPIVSELFDDMPAN